MFRLKNYTSLFGFQNSPAENKSDVPGFILSVEETQSSVGIPRVVFCNWCKYCFIRE